MKPTKKEIETLSEKRKKLRVDCLRHFNKVEGTNEGKLIKLFEIIENDDKEFIKRLKENIPEDYTSKEFRNRIDKLAGDKLI